MAQVNGRFQEGVLAFENKLQKKKKMKTAQAESKNAHGT